MSRSSVLPPNCSTVWACLSVGQSSVFFQKENIFADISYKLSPIIKKTYIQGLVDGKNGLFLLTYRDTIDFIQSFLQRTLTK